MRVYFKQKPVGLCAGELLDLVKENDIWKLFRGEDILAAYHPGGEPHSTLSELGRAHYKAVVDENEDFFSVVRYADLHRHSDYSLLDGMTKTSQMAEMTEWCGALTDHGNMYGFLDYYKKMKELGKKPIIGFEAYTCNMAGELVARHLVLLAKNETGYKNLLKLTSGSFENFKSKPQVTWEMLEKYHEGVIATAACVGGVIQRALLDHGEEEALAAVKRYQDIFGDDFYLEVQRHGLPEESAIEEFFFRVSQKYGIKVIATTDAHYPTKDDAYAHEVMLCMQRKATMAEPHWTFPGTGYWLHSSEEMEKLFWDHPEVLDNTLEIADKCDLNIKLGDVNLPKYDIPAPFNTPLEYFRHLCEEGFQTRFKNSMPPEKESVYMERFEYEFSVIEKMGFESYFRATCSSTSL